MGDDILRRDAALAADAEHECLRMIDQGLSIASGPRMRHLQRDEGRGAVCGRRIETGKRRKARRSLQPHRGAGQDRGRDALHVLGIAEHVARCRFIERHAEAQVARGGDRRVTLADCGDAACQVIGAMMAAEQRHGGTAVLGHRNHRGLAALVLQMRADGADQDAAGAEADDAPAFVEEPGEMGLGLRIGDIAARHAVGRVDLAAKLRLEYPRQGQGRDAENEDDRLHQDSPPV